MRAIWPSDSGQAIPGNESSVIATGSPGPCRRGADPYVACLVPFMSTAD